MTGEAAEILICKHGVRKCPSALTMEWKKVMASIKNWLSTDDFRKSLCPFFSFFNTVTMTESWSEAKLRVQTAQSHYGRRICGNPRRGHTGGQGPAVFAQNRQTLCSSDRMNYFELQRKNYDVRINEFAWVAFHLLKCVGRWTGFSKSPQVLLIYPGCILVLNFTPSVPGIGSGSTQPCFFPVMYCNLDKSRVRFLRGDYTRALLDSSAFLDHTFVM